MTQRGRLLFARFGWRDYDPAVGRFTAPDPLGDTGGDHDLYEYCVDDPVSMYDDTGLMGKRLPKKLGKDTAEELIFPNSLNEPEEIFVIEQRKQERKQAYETNNDVGFGHFLRIFLDTYRERDLREKYGKKYEEDPFYKDTIERIRKQR